MVGLKNLIVQSFYYPWAYKDMYDEFFKSSDNLVTYLGILPYLCILPYMYGLCPNPLCWVTKKIKKVRWNEWVTNKIYRWNSNQMKSRIENKLVGIIKLCHTRWWSQYLSKCTYKAVSTYIYIYQHYKVTILMVYCEVYITS